MSRHIFTRKDGQQQQQQKSHTFQWSADIELSPKYFLKRTSKLFLGICMEIQLNKIQLNFNKKDEIVSWFPSCPLNYVINVSQGSKFLIIASHGTPLQYSCLENPLDGGAWWAVQSMGSLSRTRLSDFTFTFHFHAWRRKWQPTPVFFPGESQGWGSLVAAIYGVAQSSTRLKWLSSSSSSHFWISHMYFCRCLLLIFLKYVLPSNVHCMNHWKWYNI